MSPRKPDGTTTDHIILAVVEADDIDSARDLVFQSRLMQCGPEMRIVTILTPSCSASCGIWPGMGDGAQRHLVGR